MIVVPHPDDESLAVAGLVQHLHQTGGSVWIVYLTDGDGYRDGVKAWFEIDEPSPELFREYGRRRRAEARAALARLGVPPKHAAFLGFPDDGLAALWLHWCPRDPWCSPHTGRCVAEPEPAHVPVAREKPAYAGETLVSELHRLLELWHPDLVVLPDPRDEHLDHCSAGLFAMLALQRWSGTGRGLPQVLTYLVHFSNYPGLPQWMTQASRSGVCGGALGREQFRGTRWVCFSLTERAVRTKGAALAAHESQWRVMAGFLKQFVRCEEVFASWNPQAVLAMAELARGRVAASLGGCGPCGFSVPHAPLPYPSSPKPLNLEGERRPRKGRSDAAAGGSGQLVVPRGGTRTSLESCYAVSQSSCVSS